jgi:hypothetical protein
MVCSAANSPSCTSGGKVGQAADCLHRQPLLHKEVREWVIVWLANARRVGVEAGVPRDDAFSLVPLHDATKFVRSRDFDMTKLWV